jgi:hypothetical protein
MYLETSTAEVSSGRARPGKTEIFSVRGSGPQGLRRPRFSFFRFTCQTARKPCGFHLPDGPEGRRSLSLRPSLGGPVPRKVRSFRGALSRRKRTARRMKPFIWFTTRHCQHQTIDYGRRRPPANSAFKPFLTGCPLSTRTAIVPHLSHIPRSFFQAVGSSRGAPSGVAGDPSRQARSLTGARTARHRAVFRFGLAGRFRFQHLA